MRLFDYIFFRTLILMLRWGHRDQLLLVTVMFLSMQIGLILNITNGLTYALVGYKYKTNFDTSYFQYLIIIFIPLILYLYFILHKRYKSIILKFRHQIPLSTRNFYFSIMAIIFLILLFMLSGFLMILRNKGQFGFFLN